MLSFINPNPFMYLSMMVVSNYSFIKKHMEVSHKMIWSFDLVFWLSFICFCHLTVVLFFSGYISWLPELTRFTDIFFLQKLKAACLGSRKQNLFYNRYNNSFISVGSMGTAASQQEGLKFKSQLMFSLSGLG